MSAKSEGDRSGFDAGEFSSRKRGRSQNLWKKGSPAFRWCGCTILTFLLLVSSIIGALALWIRPPAVTIGDVQPQTVDGKIVQMSGEELVVNLGINITVNNPNYFDVDFTKIEAKLIYPINNTPIGGGNATHIVFPKGQEKEYTFPLKISYSSAIDPNSAVLIDLGKKCGLLGSKSDLEFKYEITVGIKILFFTISPVIANSIKLACPIDPKDLTGMLGGGLGGLLGGRALRAAVRGAPV
jgi:LEA14-like dessication related protein